MKWFFPAVIIIGVVALGGYLLLRDRAPADTAPEGDSTPTTITLTQTYINETYGFSFEYPEEYDLQEYSPMAVTIGTIEGEVVDGLLEVRVFTGGTDRTETFDEFVVRELTNQCAADGPTKSISCTEVLAEEPVTTETGLSGTRYFLREVTTDFSTDLQTEKEKGPFYVFTISANTAAAHGVLAFFPPVVLSEEAISEDLIADVVDTLTLTRVETRAENATQQ